MFTHNGKPIADIKTFCKDRGEKLIEYEAIYKKVVFLQDRVSLIEDRREGVIPESFFEALREPGWTFRKIGEQALD